MVDEGIKVTCYSISFKSISMILNSENHGGLSLRGGSGARDAAIHRVRGMWTGLSVRVVRASRSPRASPSR